MQPHLRRCFEGIHRLRFEGALVMVMCSVEQEQVGGDGGRGHRARGCWVGKHQGHLGQTADQSSRGLL